MYVFKMPLSIYRSDLLDFIKPALWYPFRPEPYPEARAAPIPTVHHCPTPDEPFGLWIHLAIWSTHLAPSNVSSDRKTVRPHSRLSTPSALWWWKPQAIDS